MGGTYRLLWADLVPFEVERTYELTVVATSGVLRGFIDGVPLFTVADDQPLPAGRIGLYCSRNEDAQFLQLRVYPASVVFNEWLLDEQFDYPISRRWDVVDEGDQGKRAQWEVADGELRQTSDSYGERYVSDQGTFLPTAAKPGTYALARRRGLERLSHERAAALR